MTDLERILPQWRELEAAGAEYVLATVVAVEGSSYRRPGARMLIAQDGRRMGTVSGGCLEAEVASRAWWLTTNGPVVERYSTAEDDGERPYGSGCGGVVSILLERSATARPLLMALEAAFNRRDALAIATVLDGPRAGHRAFAGLATGVTDPLAASRDEWLLKEERAAFDSGACGALESLAASALECREPEERTVRLDGQPTRAWADYRAARPGLWIFGAGDDAQPLVRLARELGWFVAVADGRSHLATRARFAAADEVIALDSAQIPECASPQLDFRTTDAAVLMTHSFEQDSRMLATLFALHRPLAYIGVLGPQRRTRELLAEAARMLDLAGPTDDRVERWLMQIHAPTGLDLGAETPTAIALSILAEVQQALHSGTGLPLREVRAARLAAERD
jgi:xanthine/CO dehydrogenase XdhC/CoxF family maturation factor